MGLFEQHVIERAIQVNDIRRERLGQFLLQISFFRGHDLLERSRQIGVIRRHQAGLELDPQALHVFGIQGKIVRTDRPHADQADIAAEKVEELRHLVDPVFAEKLAVFRDAEIFVEFAVGREVVALVDKFLQILRVRVHGADFPQMNDLAVQADFIDLDQRAIAWRLVG